MPIIVDIPINKISPSPYQTRIDIGDIESLAENFKKFGLQQPITVRKISKQQYELIGGARRLEAARILGWNTIQAIIKDVSDAEAAAICVSENLQRENLNPIEEARAYRMLIDKFNLAHAKVAAIAGKSRSYITNSLSLLKIDEFLQARVICGELTISHVRIINIAPDNIQKFRLADIVMDWKLSVRELEDVVNRLQEKQMLLHWTREIPIEKIRIPLKAFTSKGSEYDSGVVIIDTSMALIGGLEILLNARRKGEKTVKAEVVYFAYLLWPSESWIIREKISTQDTPEKPLNRFSQVLADFVGNTEEMYNRYPVHGIISDDDYLVFLPHTN